MEATFFFETYVGLSAISEKKELIKIEVVQFHSIQCAYSPQDELSPTRSQACLTEPTH
jgi:hypothetical protein